MSSIPQSATPEHHHPDAPRKDQGRADDAPTVEPSTQPATVGAFTDNGTYTPTRAMEDVMRERWRQIHEFGHTPERDVLHPIARMHKVAHRYWQGLSEYFRVPGHDHTALRRYAVILAATLLALIDRIDAEQR